MRWGCGWWCVSGGTLSLADGAVATGHDEVLGIGGVAAALGQRAVAVAGLGGVCAVADAEGVVIDALLMRVELALGGDFSEVLHPLFGEVDVLRVCGILWYSVTVAGRRRCGAVGGVGAAAGGGGVTGVGRDRGAVSVGRAGAGI